MLRDARGTRRSTMTRWQMAASSSQVIDAGQAVRSWSSISGNQTRWRHGSNDNRAAIDSGRRPCQIGVVSSPPTARRALPPSSGPPMRRGTSWCRFGSMLGPSVETECERTSHEGTRSGEGPPRWPCRKRRQSRQERSQLPGWGHCGRPRPNGTDEVAIKAAWSRLDSASQPQLTSAHIPQTMISRPACVRASR